MTSPYTEYLPMLNEFNEEIMQDPDYKQLTDYWSDRFAEDRDRVFQRLPIDSFDPGTLIAVIYFLTGMGQEYAPLTEIDIVLHIIVKILTGALDECV